MDNLIDKYTVSAEDEETPEENLHSETEKYFADKEASEMSTKRINSFAAANILETMNLTSIQADENGEDIDPGEMEKFAESEMSWANRGGDSSKLLTEQRKNEMRRTKEVGISEASKDIYNGNVPVPEMARNISSINNISEDMPMNTFFTDMISGEASAKEQVELENVYKNMSQLAAGGKSVETTDISLLDNIDKDIIKIGGASLAKGLSHASHRGLRVFLSKLDKNNPELLKKIYQTTKGKDDECSMRVQKAIVAASEEVVEDSVNIRPRESAGAIIAKHADKSAQESLITGALAINAQGEPTATRKLIEETFDVAGGAKVLTLIPQPKGIGGLAAYVPFVALNFLRSAQGIFFAPLEGTRFDSNKAVSDAIAWWGTKISRGPQFPDIGIGESKEDKIEFQRRSFDVGDIVGNTASMGGLMAGPYRVASGAAGLVTAKLEPYARPFYQSIFKGMATGLLLGEGKKEKTLENMALFGIFEPLVFAMGKVGNILKISPTAVAKQIQSSVGSIPKKLAKSVIYKKMPVVERGLVLQSMDEAIAGATKQVDMIVKKGTLTRLKADPPKALMDILNSTEGQLLRKFDNPTWRKEALTKYVKGPRPLDIKKPQVADPITDIGTSINNANAIGETTANRIFYGEAQGRQQKVVDIHNVYIYKRNVDINAGSEEAWRGASTKGLLKRAVLAPMDMLGDVYGKALVENVTLNSYEVARLNKGFRLQMEAISKGLSKTDTQKVEHAIERSNSIEESLEITPGGLQSANEDMFFEMGEDAVDAYFASRIVMRDTYVHVRREMVKQAIQNGYKMSAADDGLVVKKTGVKEGTPCFNSNGELVKWSPENVINGDKFYARYNKDGELEEGLLVQKGKEDTQLKEIPPDYKIGGEIDGYMHIAYTDDYRVVTLVKDKNGVLSSARMTHTAKTEKRAEALVDRLKKESEEAGTDLEFISLRADDGGAVEAAYTGSFANAMHTMEPADIALLKTILIKAGYKEEVIEQFIASQQLFAYKKGAPLKPRGKERLQADEPRTEVTPFGEERTITEAPMQPGLQSMGNYLGWAARYIGASTYNSELNDMYKKVFSSVMVNKNDPMAGVLDNTGNPKLEQEARTVLEQLRIAFGYKSKTQLRLEASKRIQLDKLKTSKSPTMQLIRQGYEKLPGAWGLSQFAKGTVITYKLGLGALGQLPVQFSLIHNSIGSQAGILAFQGDRVAQLKAIAKTQADFIHYVSPSCGFTPWSKRGLEEKALIEQSGMVAEVDFVDLQNMFTDLSNLKGATNVLEKGTIFWQKGEGLSRAYAFMASKNKTIREIELGRHPKLTKKDITDGYSDQFIEETTKEAMTLAHNMSRFNQPNITKGLWGLPNMFLNYMIQQSSLFFNSAKLSKAQIAGLWFTWAGAFGIKGVPLLNELMTWGENILVATGHPEYSSKFTEQMPRYAAERMAKIFDDTIVETVANKLGLDIGGKEYWYRQIKSGFYAAATGGKIDVSNRVAIGLFFDDYYSNSPVYDALFGAPGQVAKSILRDGAETVEDLKIMVDKYGKLTTQDLVAAGRKLTKEMSGPHAIITAVSGVSEHKLRDSRGQVTVNDPTLLDILQTIMGITPGKVVEQKAIDGKIYKAQKAWGDWVNDKSKRVAQAYVETPELGDALLDKYTEQINAYNPKLIKYFVRLAVKRRLFGEIPLKERSELLAAMNALIAQSVTAGWGR